MKVVLHVVTRTNIGGVSNYLHHLISATQSTVKHVIVRGTPPEHEGDYFATHPVDVTIIDIPSLQRSINPWKELVGSLALLRVIRSVRPDVVHTHMAKAGVLGRLAAWLCRIPVRIHTFHGHLLQGYFSTATVKIIVVVERLLQRITTWSITNGEQIRIDLIQRGILRKENSVSIPPAVQPFPLVNQRKAREQLGLPVEGRIVGFVGRLAPVKRPDRFLAVAEALPSTTFVMFGDGPLGSDIRAQAATLPNLVLKGWETEIGMIYSAIDLLLLTSDNEAAAVVLIEAAVCGIPAVAMNVGSVGEVVLDHETGLLASTDAELIQATSQLVQDDILRQQFGMRARERSLSVFGIEQLAQRHLALYHC